MTGPSSFSIYASREQIWQILWSEATYRRWTPVFSETSQAQSTCKKAVKPISFAVKAEDWSSKLLNFGFKPLYQNKNDFFAKRQSGRFSRALALVLGEKEMFLRVRTNPWA
jgi:hypothetical protein